MTIHEITHAVQFSGAPWLREHLGGMLTELIDGLQVSDRRSRAASATAMAGLAAESCRRCPTPTRAARAGRAGAPRASCCGSTLGEDRWQLVERMQATMSLVEGHAEHTMDVIGAEVLPSLPRLRAAMNRRRENRGLPWRVLERLLGLELKMRQYEAGGASATRSWPPGGPQALARAWSGPDALPRPAELEQPDRWSSDQHRPPR